MKNKKLGYPYSYGDDDLVQKDLNKDEKFMIFSLDPVAENSELNLIQASSLVLLTDPSKLEGLGDEFTYHFCNQISQVCGTLSTMPGSNTLLLDYDGFCKLVAKSDTIVTTLSSNLQITPDSVIEKAQNFFRGRTIIVQAEGVQGAIYKVGSYIQSAGSASLVMNTMGLARLAGVSGFSILQAQPMLFFAVPTLGFMFFQSCGSIVGNNVVGKMFITVGDVLGLPMQLLEMVWNAHANDVIQRVFGIPVILNMTQTFKTGPGYTVDEVAKYVSIHRKSLLGIIKDRIKKWAARL